MHLIRGDTGVKTKIRDEEGNARRFLKSIGMGSQQQPDFSHTEKDVDCNDDEPE